MLTRWVANAARSWSLSCSRRVCMQYIPGLVLSRHYTPQPQSQDDPTLLPRIVQRKLQSVRTTLAVTSYNLGPSSLDEFETWRDAIKVADFDMALQNCGERLLSAPSWVMLYLFSSKVFTPSQAIAAVNIMLQHFAEADRVVQPALIILTVRFLARQQVEAPVPNLVKLFSVLDLPDPSTQFNLLLRSMSHFKPSPVLAKVTTHIIELMHGRQLKLHSRTYRALLSNSLVSLELAKKLQQSMELEGTQPNRHHLEAYLRVFAHHGAVHASARYLNLIREGQEKTGGAVPHGVELSSQGARAIKSENSVTTRWNTEFLGSFKRHTGSAFQYLRGMVEEKDIPPFTPAPARKESRFVRMRKDRPVIWKYQTRGSDWTAALNVAARDPKISSKQLLQLFDEVREKAKYMLKVPIFTVLMRGLARKGDHATALEVWKRCNASWVRRRRIDAKALTVAVEVIVANGYQLEAFNTLVETTGILFDRNNPPPKRFKTSISRIGRHLFSARAKVDAPLVNALMNAYLKHGRPDLVFKLWDVFYPLFGVRPNGDTLTIVLDAAYSVSRWDRTFRGLLEQLGLHYLFKGRSSRVFPVEEKNRKQLFQHVQRFIAFGSPSPSPSNSKPKNQNGSEEEDKEKVVGEARKFVRKTTWNGELAAPKAAKLFQDIVLGNYPQLKDIAPPAQAVWPDAAQSASPMRDALSSITSRLRGSSTHKDQAPEPKPLLLGPSILLPHQPSPSSPSLPDTIPLLTSPHPQITPTPQSFASYIFLLSSLNRASQIPLTLAWMRALHIRPLKRSLAIAIALWSEASMRGPLIEQFGGRESEFRRLERWLEEWLGREGMPSHTAVSWAFRKLKQEREK